MDSLLKRHFWVVVLFFGSLATWFFATGLTQLIAGKWLPLEPAALGGPRPVMLLSPIGNAGGPKRNLEAKTILEANPFDSVTGPIYDQPVVAIAPEPIDDVNGERMFSVCSGGPKLTIVVVDPVHPAKSFAVVSTGEGSANKPLVREGTAVNGREVAVIVREKVYFKDGGTYCYVGMFLPPEAAKPPPPAPGPMIMEPPGGPGKVPPDIEKGIQKIDDTNFNIDRTVVDKIIENQAELMKSARIVPEQENGKVVGIRLLNIRPETLLGKLGLQTGDQLRTINGFDMSSPEKALEAYAKLRTAPQIQVGVVRNGKPTNIEFNIK